MTASYMIPQSAATITSGATASNTAPAPKTPNPRNLHRNSAHIINFGDRTMASALKKKFTDRGKDLHLLKPVVTPIPYATLSKALLSPTPADSPKNHGTVSLIVERPAVNERNIVKSTVLDVEGGMENSGWERRPERGTIDQICVMSTTAIRTITGSDDPVVWAEAGDQFFFDLDLSFDNLALGDLVKVGECLLRVTKKPHTGCAKFSKRFGVDALKVVTGKLALERRLRGIYFEVVEGGVVNEGDSIVKLEN